MMSPTRRRRALPAAGIACLALSLASYAGGQETPDDGTQVAAIVRMDGVIDGLTERTLEMRVKRALAGSPRFLIVSIESPGGDYQASRTIAWSLNELRNLDVTTVAFVRGHALSGATMVAFGCELLAMAPSGQLGDVMPILPGVMAPKLAEKFISPVRKDLEKLATERTYPIDVAAAMVDPDVELHRVLRKDERGRLRASYFSREALQETPGLLSGAEEDTIVCPSGELLVIARDQAADMGMVRFFAKDEDELCRQLAEEFSIAKVIPNRIEPLWWSSAVRFITWWPVKTLLFVIGAISLLVAFAQPGTGAPEALAVICFAAVFFGSYLIGLADWVELVLLVVGLGLLGVEIFITPGFGVLGSLGVLALFAALLLSFQKFVVPSNPLEWDLMGWNLAKTFLGFILAAAGLALALRLLPRTRLAGGLMHEHTLGSTPLETSSHQLAPIGATGVTTTQLRPVGKVKVHEQVFDARAQDGMVDQGATVVVVGHQAYELVVSSRPEAITLAKAEGQSQGEDATSPSPSEPVSETTEPGGET